MDFEKRPENVIKRPISNDYLEVDSSEGMPGLVDSTVALSLLLNVKSGVRNCAIALTEIAEPEAREEVRKMLDAGIDLHTQVSELMMAKGWFHPYHISEQFDLDMISSKTAFRIAGMQLFPGDTSRLGTFATPNY